MVHARAEQSFESGLKALKKKRGQEALAMFEAAIEIERRHGIDQPQPRYLSFYGLCLALHRKRIHEGLRCCKQALSREFYNGDLYLNLSRVLLLMERRGEAYKVLRKGLGMHPNHSGLLNLRRQMGYRRRPVIPFLKRDNPINVALGRLSIAS